MALGGWCAPVIWRGVRPGDLARLVSAFDDVFTFHSDELERFRELLIRKGGGHA